MHEIRMKRQKLVWAHVQKSEWVVLLTLWKGAPMGGNTGRMTQILFRLRNKISFQFKTYVSQFSTSTLKNFKTNKQASKQVEKKDISLEEK